MNTSIVWFRRDLRLADNPALAAAAARRGVIVPLFILENGATDSVDLEIYEAGSGKASGWWLHHSLTALDKALNALGMRMVLRRGDPLRILQEVSDETGSDAVFWNRRYEPNAGDRDRKIKRELRLKGISVESFNGSLLVEPWALSTKANTPFKVFTPFWKALQQSGDQGPALPLPTKVKRPAASSTNERLDDWRLLPRNPDWTKGFAKNWRPGEAGARARLEAFLNENLLHYRDGRDRPDQTQVSRLSPHLHWGEISPRQIWQATLIACDSAASNETMRPAAWAFLRELGWREFSYHLLYHWPDLPTGNWRPSFDNFPWNRDEAAFCAWTKGLTGYPMVDAGMRQLWSTGWMHNRVRMITASFLIKDLLIDWRKGASWFAGTLLDADMASNSASWQWVAGSGADASPFFRVFNPVSQGEKFDPDGVYVRTWVPELAELPDRWIHRPWQAPTAVLKEANVTLGGSYPLPIIDHTMARQRALAAFKSLREDATPTA